MLNGWGDMLHERCTKSELHDTKLINYQNLKSANNVYQRNNEVFVYAAHLKPGLHQFVIYDPASKRAFCKEFVLDLNDNLMDFPELPDTMGIKKKAKKIPDVWVPWKDDSLEQKQKSHKIDTRVEKFELELFIKRQSKPNMKEIRDITKKYLDNFDVLKVLQKEMLVRSEKDPKIDFESFY